MTNPSEEFRPKAETILTCVFNAYTKGKGVPNEGVVMKLGSAIYEEYERHLIALERFVEVEIAENMDRRLLFKTARLVKDLNAWNPYAVTISHDK